MVVGAKRSVLLVWVAEALMVSVPWQGLGQKKTVGGGGCVLGRRSSTPIGKRVVERRLMQDEFHAEGDNTGDYELSGMWRLTRRVQNDGLEARLKIKAAPEIETVPRSDRRRWPVLTSWSGNGWSSPARPSVPLVKRTTVVLKARGTFESPPDASEIVRGSWSCDGEEVVLAKFGRGSQVEEWYTGRVQKNGSSVGGTVAYGASEPEYTGTFTLDRAMPQLHPVTRKPAKPRGVEFDSKDLVGNWTLQFSSSSTFSVFVLELRPDLSWTSISGVGDPSADARLAGKWNVFDEKIDLGSGIPGTGKRLFLWLRRFGTSGGVVSKGVALNADQLFMGTIAPASQRGEEELHDESLEWPQVASAAAAADQQGTTVSTTRPQVKDVRGSVAVGWSIEPVFIGRFVMKRWYGDDPAADFSALPVADADDDDNVP